jgi:hypothetical protein
VDALELVRLDLLSPMVLALALGTVATLVRSDLLGGARSTPEGRHARRHGVRRYGVGEPA